MKDDKKQKLEYQEIAKRLKHISSKPPKTFHDALQLMWTFHIAVLNEHAISGLSPGRWGKILYPFWKRDMDKGILDKSKTLELLECMRVKFTEIDCFASMGVVGGVLSGSTFNNMCVGGLDKNGNSAANELESLIIESGITCGIPQPTLSMLYDEKLPIQKKEINLLPLHHLSKEKYKMLDKKYFSEQLNTPDHSVLETLKNIYSAHNISCYIASNTPF